jgi:hypothetical protein
MQKNKFITFTIDIFPTQEIPENIRVQKSAEKLPIFPSVIV